MSESVKNNSENGSRNLNQEILGLLSEKARDCFVSMLTLTDATSLKQLRGLYLTLGIGKEDALASLSFTDLTTAIKARLLFLHDYHSRMAKD